MIKAIKKILVIDDEPPIRKFLRVSLENEGYQVIEASTAKDGIRELIGTRPDVVILDLGLPDMGGLEVIAKVREWSKVPIVVLTVREDEETKVMALDAGADDYLTKPFGVPELMARLRVAERHSLGVAPNLATFRSGPLEVDLSGHVVKIQDKEVHLTSTEFAILKLLIKHAGKVVTHRQILQEIWGPHSVEHTQYLRVYLGHLRKKLESSATAEKIIATEPGVGYRLLVL
jgi:two-component system KDP operon response regulator KdpE